MSSRHGLRVHPAPAGRGGTGAAIRPEDETEEFPAVGGQGSGSGRGSAPVDEGPDDPADEHARRPVPWGWIGAGVVGLLLAGNGIVAAGLSPSRGHSGTGALPPAPVVVTASLVPQAEDSAIPLPPPSPTAAVTPSVTAAAPTPTRRPERVVLPRVTPTPTSSATPSATASATPTPTASAACMVTYRVQNSWNDGYVAQLSIRNTGVQPLRGWTLTFSLPRGQVVVNGWGARFQQSGDRVWASGLSYDAELAANATAAVGYQASFFGRSAGYASGFALNGTPCTVH